MTGSGTLEALAEVSIAFAGFSSLVVVFRQRGTADWLPQEVSTLWSMVGSSLACLLFSLVPLALDLLGLAESTLWRLASLLLAAGMLAGLVATRRHEQRLRQTGFQSLRPALSRVREPVLGPITGLVFLNSLFFAGPGLYVVGLIALLGHASAGLLYFLSFLGGASSDGE